MSSLAHELRFCLLCRSTNLETVLALRPIPIATPGFIVPPELRDSADPYSAVPLDLHLCRDCGQLQVSHCPDVELEYRHYAYQTSHSIGLFKHFKAYAKDLIEQYAPPRDGFVVEIGSNDGTLLHNFVDAGMKVLGIDPASSIAAKATADGVHTIPNFFSHSLAKQIRAEEGPADVVIANFVTANIEDMVDFAEGVHTLLGPKGVAMMETQYGVDVVELNLLDTIYHEHLSYYMLTPLVKHYARHGLEIIDVKREPSKGGSIRITMQPFGAGRPVSSRVHDLMEEEERKGALTPRFYAGLPTWIDEIRNGLHRIIKEERAAGKKIAGWGVSVGTTTLLGQFDLGNEIDFLLDDDPEKEPFVIGPDYSIPVIATDEFYRRMPGAVIVFAWRYIASIMEKHRRYLEAGGKFVVPLPHVSVVSGAEAKAPNTIGV